MNKIQFRQIPKNARLLALGNHFRPVAQKDQWRIATYFRESDNKDIIKSFEVDVLCIMALGRTFIQSEGKPYKSMQYSKKIKFPPISEWTECHLKDCPQLSYRLQQIPEIAEQKCFSFEINGINYWLPKFELARKLFFHAGFIVRAAYQPHGLDLLFYIQKDEDKKEVHIHTASKTGIPSSYIKHKGYRELFSWIVLNDEVRNSFESIWVHINKEQYKYNNYSRWMFNFSPPASLSNLELTVRGPFSADTKNMIIWEIADITGLVHNNNYNVFFHHPAINQSTMSGQGGEKSSSEGVADIDIEQEPDDSKEIQLIELPSEGLSFSKPIPTFVSYNSKKTGGYKGGGEAGENSLGIKDPISNGDGVAGDFDLLDDEDVFVNHFMVLKQCLIEIAKSDDISMDYVRVKALPILPRCGFHLMNDNKPRCYLIAKFTLINGQVRHLFEIDTSDYVKSLSTQVIQFKREVNISNEVENIFKLLVRSSLRWPKKKIASLSQYVKPVQHPEKSSQIEEIELLAFWKLRLNRAISGSSSTS